MTNNRDLKFAFAAGVITAILLLPILLNLEKLNLYTASVSLAYPFAALVGMWVVKKNLSSIIWFFQFSKFALTGAMNTILDMGIINFLSYLTGIYSGIYIVLLNSVSFIVAVTNSYFWNKHWTFARTEVKPLAEGDAVARSAMGEFGAAKATEYLEFIAVAFVGLLLNNAVVYTITTYAPTNGLTPAMVENLAKILATVIVMSWNFTGFKFFVFKA